MTTTNEAADLLRTGLRNSQPFWNDAQWATIERDLDAALAAERRATVERIREQAAGRWETRPLGGTERERQAWANGWDEYAAILDEEAAR